MAGPACMADDGRNAVFVGTMLQTGDAVALCDECLVAWAAAVLSTMTGVDPAPFLAAISETDAEGPPHAPGGPGEGDVPAGRAGPDRPATGRRGRTSAASPGPGTAGDPDAGTTPEATADASSAA